MTAYNLNITEYGWDEHEGTKLFTGGFCRQQCVIITNTLCFRETYCQLLQV